VWFRLWRLLVLVLLDGLRVGLRVVGWWRWCWWVGVGRICGGLLGAGGVQWLICGE
jgi:hypothetical protein